MRWRTALLFIPLLSGITAQSTAVDTPADLPEYLAGQLIVMVKDDVHPRRAPDLLTSHSHDVLQVEGVYTGNYAAPEDSDVRRLFLLRFPEHTDILAQAREYSAAGFVRWAEPNYLFTPAFVPDDSLYSDQWYLPQIQAPEAYDLARGDTSIVIAILDSGADLDHEDLVGELLPGYDFFDGDSIPEDNIGHGTSVSGIAGATTDNESGIASAGWRCRILPLRIADGLELPYLAIYEAWTHVRDNRAADVVSMSFLISVPLNSMEQMMQDLVTLGIVPVAAAGNFGSEQPYWPAAFPTVISTAATDEDDTRCGFSNYGDWVDVAAPGVGITTTDLDNGYSHHFGGTSAACPMVAGTVSLMLSRAAAAGIEFGPAEIRQILIDTSDPVTGFPAIQGGRINAYQALRAIVLERACCIDEQCWLFSQEDCASGGGVWLPAVRTCDPDPCTEYACCVGEHCEILIQDECTAIGGIWLENIETCDPDPCIVYVCCISGSCQLLRQSSCVAAGGQWLEGVVSCDPNPCGLAACCIGETCSVTILSACMDLGGEWHPEWSSCYPNPCPFDPPRVCCVSEECLLAVSPADCAALGGEWHAELTSCDPNPCSLAACCTGETCSVIILHTCTDLGGDWYPEWSSCDPNPCPFDPPRACCVSEECILAVSPADCATLGGEWHPEWTSCDGNPCLPYGDLADGVLITHHVPQMIWTNPAPPEGWCEHYLNQYAIDNVHEQNTRIDYSAGNVAIWFVLAAWDQPKEFCAVQFGLSDYNPDIFVFYESGPCFVGQGIELPSGGWPGPNAGVALTTASEPWLGSILPVYHFTGYAYPGETLISLTVDNTVSIPFGGFANCEMPGAAWDASCFGAMGINTPGTPCYPGGTHSVCCMGGQCFLVSQEDCAAMGGEWHIEWPSCTPNPCDASAVAPGATLTRTAFLPALPNPFSGAVQLSYELAHAGDVRFAIFDPTGRLVRSMDIRATEGGGTISWDGCDDHGARVAPGTYFCRMMAGGRTWTQRLVVVD